MIPVNLKRTYFGRCHLFPPRYTDKRKIFECVYLEDCLYNCLDTSGKSVNCLALHFLHYFEFRHFIFSHEKYLREKNMEIASSDKCQIL